MGVSDAVGLLAMFRLLSVPLSTWPFTR